MIKRLRRKFVLTMLLIEMLFVAAILTGLYVNMRTGFERSGFASMHQAAMRASGAPPEGSGDTRSSNRSARPPRDADREGASPVSVLIEDASGEVRINQNQIYFLDDEALLSLYAQADAQKQTRGLLESGTLRYLRLTLSDGRACVVLASTDLERQILRNQIFLSLAILLGSAALFYGISLVLSRFIVRPVEEAFERERQFVADASHELKTPLTVVLSNADMLSASNAVTDEKNLRRLDHIRAESRRMRGLVEDLLLLARSDTGKAPAVHSPQCISHLTACALAGIEPAIFDAGRTLGDDIAPALYVSGDANQLCQLLNILLDNACKYSLPASIISVKLHAVSHREAALLVTSEGNPIPAAEHEAVFRRFYRLDPSRGRQPGYGLGLAIAQSIVSEHHGRIGVRNDTPTGNTFFVLLPRCPAPQAKQDEAG